MSQFLVRTEAGRHLNRKVSSLYQTGEMRRRTCGAKKIIAELSLLFPDSPLNLKREERCSKSRLLKIRTL
jgi:hypothetical protein